MGYIVIALLIFILDDKIKEYVDQKKLLHRRKEILGGTFFIEKYYNKGAMLNLFENHKKLVKYGSGIAVIALSLVLLVLAPKKGKSLLKLGLSLVLGGALSNVYDRLKKGHVVDYFGFKFLNNVIFNISDIFIFIGSFFVLMYNFITEFKTAK